MMTPLWTRVRKTPVMDQIWIKDGYEEGEEGEDSSGMDANSKFRTLRSGCE
jgi:hypothetical protein